MYFPGCSQYFPAEIGDSQTHGHNKVGQINNKYFQASSQGWGAGKFFSGSDSGSWLFFQVALAPAPDFFPKRLRLRLLVFFFERLRLHGAKNTRLRLLGKIFFSLQTSKIKLQKNI